MFLSVKQTLILLFFNYFAQTNDAAIDDCTWYFTAHLNLFIKKKFKFMAKIGVIRRFWGRHCFTGANLWELWVSSRVFFKEMWIQQVDKIVFFITNTDAEWIRRHLFIGYMTVFCKSWYVAIVLKALITIHLLYLLSQDHTSTVLRTVQWAFLTLCKMSLVNKTIKSRLILR